MSWWFWFNRFPFFFSYDAAAADPAASEGHLNAPDINIIPSTPLATSPNVVLQQEEEEEEEDKKEEKETVEEKKVREGVILLPLAVLNEVLTYS